MRVCAPKTPALSRRTRVRRKSSRCKLRLKRRACILCAGECVCCVVLCFVCTHTHVHVFVLLCVCVSQRMGICSCCRQIVVCLVGFLLTRAKLLCSFHQFFVTLSEVSSKICKLQLAHFRDLRKDLLSIYHTARCFSAPGLETSTKFA